MKKLFVLIVASLLMVGLTGCDLFNPEDIPEVCEEGFELVGTECVPIEDEGDAPVITLTGNATVTIAVGDSYTDAGATATDTEDGNLTSSIAVVNPVDVNTAGTYTITYNVTDSDGNAATTVSRTVIVVEPGDTDPVITLNGDASITINAGDAFTDQGATATDLEDGTLTGDIVVTGSVDPNTAGVYVLTYTITDSDLNTATVTRTITVLPSDAEVLANYIVDNWDGTLQFLGLTMANMDFSTAMNMSFEVDFEVTEDIDEVHYINAVVTDQWLYAETGDTMHREIVIDVNDEVQLTVNLIVQEVETGVHLYIEYRPILDMIAAQDPEITDMLGWVGFDDQWALFQLDDTLENVVEVAVVKDMIVSLFFSEMGEMFFYNLQEDMIEQAIGFDLDQYGVHLGAFIDLLIEEDFTAAELMLEGIEVENIILHIDHMYVAWHLYEFFMDFETELAADGFDTTKLDKLNTATYNAGTDEMEVNLPIDPLDGTQAFFESLTETELDSLIEIVLKPMIEMMVYQSLLEDANPEWLQGDFEAMLGEYQTFLTDNWPESSDPFVYADELAAVQADGARTYWENLTEEEQGIFWWAIDHHNRTWVIWELEEYERYQEEYQPMLIRYGHDTDIEWITGSVEGLINEQVDYLFDTYGIFASDWLTQLDFQGVTWWYHDLPQEQKDMLWDLSSQPGMEHYGDAIGQLSYLAERPWDYQYWYENWDHSIGVDHATWTIEELFMYHGTYLTDEYGWDTDAVFDEIMSYDHQAIEWWLYHATDDQRDQLFEVADFQWEEHYTWTLEQLEDIRFNLMDYRVYYGRSTEMHDFYWLNEETEMLILNSEAYLNDNYPTVDVQSWVDGLWMDGLPNWWNNLSQGERDILDEISMLNDGWYRWPIELMIMRDNNPGEFGIGLCNWEGHCIEDQWLTQDLVQIINDNAGYFMDEGYDVAALVAEIQMYGAMDWYQHHTNEQDRDMLRQIAEWSEWRYRVLDKFYHLEEQEDELLSWLYNHQAELDAIGFDATQKIADLELYGIQVFVADYLTEADIELLAEEYVYPKIDGLIDAIDLGEVPEYLIATFFGNPHVDYVLGMLEPTPEFDPFDVLDIDNLQANLIAIDFDALVLETVDLEALADAIYNGPTAYGTFLTGLETTAPNSELILSLFAPAVEQLQPFMIYVDDFNYAMDGLSVFEHYFDPTYWLDESGMDIDLEVTEDYEVSTTMVMDSIMYQLVVEDLFDDINTYLLGFETLPFPFDENWECVPDTDPYYDEYCEDLELNNLMAILTQIGDINVNMTFDPSDPTWMQMQLDLTEFLDVIVYKSNEWILDDPDYVPDEYNDILTGVNNATITVTMSEGGTITLPDAADTDDVNAIAYEMGKFGIAMFARDYLRELVWHYEMYPDQLADLILAGPATYSVSDFDFIRTSAAFDNDLSTIGVTINGMDAEFSLTLYWIDGTEALNGSVPLSDFMDLFDEFNELTGQAAVDAMIAFVNEDNYSMTKLWLMFLMQEDDHYMDEPEYR